MLWITLSYVVGRYGFSKKEKIYIVFKNTYKSIFTLFISFLLLIVQFWVFWDWNYMNFDSFSNFINLITNLYIKIFIVSTIFQIILSLYLAGNYSKETLWFFLGNLKRKNELIQIIGLNSNFKIKIYNQNNTKKTSFKTKEVIVDEEQNLLGDKNIKLLFDLKNKGIKFIKISNWCEKYLNRFPSELIKLNDIIDGQFSYDEYSIKGRLKRIAETLVSIFILLLSFPILILASLLIKIEDGGPIFYTQSRTGFEGKIFKIIKLRTMIINAEKNGEQWSSKNDKRITNIGNILRKLRIDELPQLLLVISGEMSLIGPRPERPNIDNFLRKEIPNYDLRYSIKPGISGWAQVNYPYGASLEDSKYKLSYDLYYIKNFSIFLDFMILLKTIKLVLNGKGSRPIDQN
tara:strand:+ start:1129 stop:2337 length:1209 start_codon:yes stop_codon:yes gene_type:complete